MYFETNAYNYSILTHYHIDGDTCKYRRDHIVVTTTRSLICYPKGIRNEPAGSLGLEYKS